MYQLEEYLAQDGKSPFNEWLRSLKDKRARAKIRTWLDRVMLGNFGDCEAIGSGLSELREHYGQGFRVYFTTVDQTIILLLAGSTKKDQDKAIKKAKEYYADYRKRKGNDDGSK